MATQEHDNNPVHVRWKFYIFCGLNLQTASQHRLQTLFTTKDAGDAYFLVCYLSIAADLKLWLVETFAQVPLVMTMPWLILLTITWYWYCSWVLNMQPYQSIILSTLLQYRIFTIKIWDAIKIHIKVLRKVDEALILHSPLYVSTEWVTGYSKLTKLMIYCKGGGRIL